MNVPKTNFDNKDTTHRMKPKHEKKERGRSSTPKRKISTTLKKEAKKGDKELEVVSIRGFLVGQTIKIGALVYEEHVVAGFGSLKLKNPSACAYLEGTPIVVLSTPMVPSVRLDLKDESVNNDEENDLDDESVTTDGLSVKLEFDRGAKHKPSLPPLPRYRSEIRLFQIRIKEAVEQISRRLDKKESRFLNQTAKIKYDDPDSNALITSFSYGHP